MSKPETALSASRIKTAQACSWLYYAKYKLMLPDPSNDGAKRGSICHLIFEVLGNKRHKKTFQKIVKSSDVFASKSVKKLILKHARKSGIDDSENIESIKEMILNGLLYDFYGEVLGQPTEDISEKDFDITIDSDGKKYKIKGFIDKLFLYKDKSVAIIRDFKSSKQMFKGKEISDNLQDYMYSLAVKHMYPEYKKRISEFLFLKFDLSNGRESEGSIGMLPITDDDLEGFEFQLTEIQEYLDNFSESDAIANLAARQKFPSDNSFGGPLQCGRSQRQGQLKKDGSVMWSCPMKYPFDYYHIYKNNQLIKPIFDYEYEEYLKQFPIEGGYEFKKMSYKGCPHYYPESY